MRKQSDEDIDAQIATLIGYVPAEGETPMQFYSQDATLVAATTNAAAAAQQWCSLHPGEWEFVPPQKLNRSPWWVAQMIKLEGGARGKKYTGFDMAPAGAICTALINMMRKL